jgi:hypothetical protein
MPSAIEQVVNIYVSLGSRQRLEAMRLERQQAVLELRNQSGKLSAPVRQLEDEIAVIDGGLQKLPY